MNVTRALALFRALYGAGLLLAPEQALGRAGEHGRHHPRERRVVQILGIRHVLQAGSTTVKTGPRARLAGAAVDSTHCVSMLGLALLFPRHRRAALIDAAAAAAFVAADGGWAVARQRKSPPGS